MTGEKPVKVRSLQTCFKYFSKAFQLIVLLKCESFFTKLCCMLSNVMIFSARVSITEKLSLFDVEKVFPSVDYQCSPQPMTNVTQYGVTPPTAE